jgi:fatty-acid peroxygenase
MKNAEPQSKSTPRAPSPAGEIPRDRHFDATLRVLLSEGYRYISTRCEELDTDIFRTRLLLQPAVCIRGEGAAKLFYDNALVKRAGAAPKRIRKSLLGEGGVHGLDDEQHVNRKQMFLSLMTPANIEQLRELTLAAWKIQSESWQKLDRVVLLEEAPQILCRAVCEWAGIPLGKDLRARARDLLAMVDAFGGVGPRYWRGTWARRRTERWIGQIIREIRAGALRPAGDAAASVVALHRDTKGALLDEQIAAVELINVIRPTVAVTYLIVFCALALHLHPEERGKVSDGNDLDGNSRALECFVQEVRRFYPFAPVMGGIARKDIHWRGYRIPADTLLVLDLYGTNHDPRSWSGPDEFRPARFGLWNGSPYNFIPQGGGDFEIGHRCAGEWITIELLKIAVRFLTTNIRYEVPAQDLRVPMNRMPSRPAGGFVMEKVQSV